MLIRHAFQLGDLVLAKTEGHPYWPARVQACIKNGCYLVSFFGQKSEASVLPQMVIKFSTQNLDRMRKEKELVNVKSLKEAVKLAQRVVEQRKKGNFQFEEDALMGGKPQIKKKATKMVPITLKESSQNRSSLSQSIDYSSSRIPPSRQIKTLLDKLLKHCVNFSNTSSSPIFTQQDEKKLLMLLDPRQGVTLQEIMDKWVLERMILALRAFEQWGAPSYQPLFEQIKKRYSEFSQAILSQRFTDLSMETSRRQRLIRRTKEFRVDVEESDHPLNFDCDV